MHKFNEANAKLEEQEKEIARRKQTLLSEIKTGERVKAEKPKGLLRKRSLKSPK